LIPGKTTLFQRVILRPGATLHAQPGAAQGRPAAGFSVAHVYARRDGWIEIGREADGRVDGWVREDRAIDWRHAMVGAFTNPAGRERAMFLREAAGLRGLLTSPQMTQEAAALRAAAGQPGSPVLALEPETFIDIQRNFYLLPILEAETVQRRDGTQMRMLEVISAPAELRQAPQQADPSRLRDFRGAVVFVVDTTISMQPYIDRTRDAIRRIVARIGDTAVRDNFRFGMVAYRADISSPATRIRHAPRRRAGPVAPARSDTAGTRGRQRRDRLHRAVRRGCDRGAARRARPGGLASIRRALRGAHHRCRRAGRDRPQVPDAARHPGDPRAGGCARRGALRDPPADARGPREPRPGARAVHRADARGCGGVALFPVEGGSPQAFERVVNGLTNALLRQVADTVGRPVGGVEPARTPEAERIAQQVEIVGTAMRLAYLGREGGTTAPDVVRSFVTDRDLADPTLPRSMCACC
jgi:serine/threonine-protein kinase PpkA